MAAQMRMTFGTATANDDGGRCGQATAPDDVSAEATVRETGLWLCRCGCWVGGSRCGWCNRERRHQMRAVEAG